MPGIEGDAAAALKGDSAASKKQSKETGKKNATAKAPPKVATTRKAMKKPTAKFNGKGANWPKPKFKAKP